MLQTESLQRIGVLRVCGQYGRKPDMRMQMGRLFSSIDFRPRAMPPSSILLIDKMVERIPAEQSLSTFNLDEKRRLESVLKKRLGDIYREAGRPERGRVTRNSKSVLFGDKGEMLACFCLSLINGRTASEWWWRSYFGTDFAMASPLSVVMNFMQETPQVVPAVIDQLTEWRCANDFVKLIDEPNARRITSVVLRAYGLSEIERQLYQPVAYSEVSEHHHENLIKPGDHGNEDYGRDDRPTAKVSVASVYDSDAHNIGVSPFLMFHNRRISEAGLSKPQISLLGFSRLLQESPTALRNPTVVNQIINWWRNKPETGCPPKDKNMESLTNATESSALVDEIRQTTTCNEPQDRHAQPHIVFPSIVDKRQDIQDEINNTVVGQGASEVTDQSRKESELEGNGLPNKRSRDAHTSRHEEDLINLPDKARSDAAQTALGQNERKPLQEISGGGTGSDIGRDFQESETHSDHLLSEETSLDSDLYLTDEFCYTELGGLLYLINLLEQIELPRGLQCAPDLEQHLSHWALLDAVSRALMGKNFSTYKADPIWQMLAGLDGRKLNIPIGTSVPRYSYYAMPKKWFTFFSEISEPSYYWATHKGRLRVWFDLGILIERDLDSSSNIEDQVYEAVRMYSQTVDASKIIGQKFSQAPAANPRQLQRIGISKGLARLLSPMLPSIQNFLKATLELANGSNHQLIRELLSCDARIFIGPSHLDLATSVNNTSFKIRASGLDQDPGWLPEYGRVVLFHFSQS